MIWKEDPLQHVDIQYAFWDHDTTMDDSNNYMSVTM